MHCRIAVLLVGRSIGILCDDLLRHGHGLGSIDLYNMLTTCPAGSSLQPTITSLAKAECGLLLTFCTSNT